MESVVTAEAVEVPHGQSLTGRVAGRMLAMGTDGKRTG